ncbi:MAG TPA: IS200/IS605 family transposase [Armatimonadota bacterium]|jgi:REP element-mobilizing transposase RayT
MPGSHAEIYVHLVWTTVARQPLLAGKTRDIAYAVIRAECESVRAQPIALGGFEDHVHLLSRLPATLDISHLAKQVKGVSSHAIRQVPDLDGFGWQEGYSGFSVSRWDVPKMTKYIANQEEHHRGGTAKAILEPSTD